MSTAIDSLRDTEMSLIKKTLEICNYNQKAAAGILGITRDSLIRKLKKYNITIKRKMDPS